MAKLSALLNLNYEASSLLIVLLILVQESLYCILFAEM
jgi:hypothetical protein